MVYLFGKEVFPCTFGQSFLFLLKFLHDFFRKTIPELEGKWMERKKLEQNKPIRRFLKKSSQGLQLRCEGERKIDDGKERMDTRDTAKESVPGFTN